MKPEGLRRLTEAIRRDREVEVDAEGRVREVKKPPVSQETTRPKNKVTKLAPRTFGVVPAMTDRGPDVDLERALKSAKHVRVFLPVQDQFGHPLPLDETLDHVRNALLLIAGGATVVQGVGSWAGADQSTTHEPIRILESYLPRVPTVFEITRFLEVLWRLLRVADQEALAIAVDGTLFLLAATGTAIASRAAA